MKPRKKNTFFTFIFSFIPGAAEMYMGFMKSGISLFSLFVAPIMLTGMLYYADYITILSGIVYVVSFFHARNIATAPDDEFINFKDKFIWEEYLDMNIANTSSVYKKWLAIALVIIGGCGIWSLLRENIFKLLSNFSEQDIQFIKSIINSIPRLVFSVFIIVFGITLIKGKKKELIEEHADDTNEE